MSDSTALGSQVWEPASDGNIQIADFMRRVPLLKFGWVYWAGNGGCAAIADHMASEMVSGFADAFPGRRSLSLTSNASLLTALANDHDFESSFGRIVDVLIRNEDVLIVLSTSGESRNLRVAAERAAARGALVISLVGQRGCSLVAVSAESILVQAVDTSAQQDEFNRVAHLLCRYFLGIEPHCE